MTGTKKGQKLLFCFLKENSYDGQNELNYSSGSTGDSQLLRTCNKVAGCRESYFSVNFVKAFAITFSRTPVNFCFCHLSQMSTLESKNVTVRAVFCLIFMHFLVLYILKGQFHICSCQRYGFFENRHSVHLGVNPPQKHHPLFFAKPPLKSENCRSPPLFRQSSICIGFS